MQRMAADVSTDLWSNGEHGSQHEPQLGFQVAAQGLIIGSAAVGSKTAFSRSSERGDNAWSEDARAVPMQKFVSEPMV